MITSSGEEINEELLGSYFRTLVNRFFKILPIREDGDQTLPTYLKTLQVELFGLRSLIPDVGNDPMFLTLLSVLQYFRDTPDAPVEDVRREVFRTINICKKIARRADERLSEGGDTK